MDEIKNMKKSSFMNIVKRKIEKHSFEKLQQKKMVHSKMYKLEHSEIEIQNMCNQINQKFIFKLRCRVTNLKINLQGKYDELEYEACGDQCKHLKLSMETEKSKKCSMINF